MQFSLRPIGYLESCFKEKFGIPRQPGLVPEATAVLRLGKSPEMRDAVRGLEGFSHIWVLFVFHQAPRQGWKALVRPPRLGGAKKIGVLATRSPHRPNFIGMSLVRLERVSTSGSGGVEIHLRGGDFLEGTPVIDIKPYIPYADSVRGARAGWAETRIPKMRVSFSAAASRDVPAQTRKLIRQMLALDPRPSFQARRDASDDSYAARLLDLDVHWVIRGKSCRVTRIDRISEE